MARGWIAALLAVGCSSSDDGGGKDASDTGGSDTGTEPTERCTDPGPDAPVVLEVDPDVWVFQGFNVVSYVPPNPRGLVWYFYGGDTLDEIVGDEQTALYWNQMVREGFGVVATERTTPGQGSSWISSDSSPRSNPDLARILDLWEELVDTTDLAGETPIAFSGFSDGAGMASSMGAWAEELGMTAISVSAHNGTFGQTPRVPVLYHIGEHDTGEMLLGLDRAVQDARDQGVRVEKIVYEERPITPECFLRRSEWDLEMGQTIFDDLLAAGMIDEAGVRLVPDDQIGPAIGAWGRRTSINGSAAVEQRLNVMWATHRFSGLDAARECRFILDSM